MYINNCRLPVTTSVSAGDLVPLFSQNGGIEMVAALSTLSAYFNAQAAAGSSPLDIYYAPTTGQTITSPETSQSLWIMLQPIGTIVALSIVLPSGNIAVDNQEALITTTQDITSLNLSSVGLNISGVPIGLTSTTPLKYKLNKAINLWVAA